MLYCIEKLVTRKRQRITIISPFCPKSERLTTTKKQYFDSKEYHFDNQSKKRSSSSNGRWKSLDLNPLSGGPLNKEDTSLDEDIDRDRGRKKNEGFPSTSEFDDEEEWNNLRKM